jgi:AraC family transcriptional regulator of adaptative response/methylated-DNA-[protein]-cysteine methyltransferase
MFVKIEAMTAIEYKNGAENLSLSYGLYDSCFGEILIASSLKGICNISFADSRSRALEELKNSYPKACFQERKDLVHNSVVDIFNSDFNNPQEVKLHLKASEFQVKVWAALLSIPTGHLSSYGDIAKQINNPKASPVVGTAIANNPLS